MPVLKNRTQGFTVIANDIFRDRRIRLRSLGLLCQMLSLPDEWHFTERGLAALFDHDGRDAIRSAVKDLEDLGYLRRYRLRDESGKFGDWVWEISDTPRSAPGSENPTLENPTLENPTAYKIRMDKAKSDKHTPPTPSEDIEEDRAERAVRECVRGHEEEEAWRRYLAAYPKPLPDAQKRRARRKFGALYAQHGEEWIAAQVEAYIADEKRQGRERRFWKNAAAWLLDGCAEASYEATKPARKRPGDVPRTATCPSCGGEAVYEPATGLHWCSECGTAARVAAGA